MRVLILDDNSNDRVLAMREIRKGFPEADLVQVDSKDAFEAALARGDFAAVITDYSMGWLDGLHVLRRVKAKYPDVPVLMLTGTGGEEVAVEAMKEGADDYLLKSQLRFDRLPRAVAGALERARQRVELAHAEQRFGELFRSVPVGLCRCAADGRVLEGNPAAASLFGFEPGGLEGTSLPSLIEDGETAWRAALGGAISEVRVARSDGKTDRDAAWAVLGVKPASINGTSIFECALTDISENKRAAREREALLGELYHRVNNTLQLLVGMVTAQLPRIADPGARQVLDDLARRIHAVSLVQHRLYESENFTEVVFADFLRDLTESLAGSSGPRIRLDLSPVLLPVAQAVPLGLAANELLTNCLKHAFPAGQSGEITVRLAHEGNKAVLDIADDGVGIPPATERRDGYGTRLLGLLARQAGASMDVVSAPKGGTRATLRVPLGSAP